MTLELENIEYCMCLVQILKIVQLLVCFCYCVKCMLLSFYMWFSQLFIVGHFTIDEDEVLNLGRLRDKFF